jgi:exodeoxyribonuclease VII large subunit
VTDLHRRLGDPERRVRDVAQHLGRARPPGSGMPSSARSRGSGREVTTASARLVRSGPQPGLRRARSGSSTPASASASPWPSGVRQARARLEHAVGRLDALSPLACLARGYAIVRKGDARGAVVSDAATLAAGDAVALVFARGRARALIDATEPAKET